ncbi:universal stress protein UspA and related nucleotide-binding proteins [Candidatus Scalindua japonica]|uniref:Universal stress protein UspA and related nucleotide-binding proteins n=1 Tax=Candidatus Scalindua japonica TaxID=1284222 RepID=A0A286TWT4_9BACT|nr:universal stress protein UspA and related nucleotide-binding proteins [Candidatus Scalindua japonica]
MTSKGYKHNIVRKPNDVERNLLTLAHRAISPLKRLLSGTHQGDVHQSPLDYYLDELAFRYIRKTSRSRGKLFYCLVQ